MSVSKDDQPYVEHLDPTNISRSKQGLLKILLLNIIMSSRISFFNLFLSYFNLYQTAALEPLYFEPYLPEAITASTDEECFQTCINTVNCVQYVFFSSYKRCYSITTFNPVNGIEDRNANIRSIKQDLSSYLLDNLSLESVYKIKIEYITPYGIRGTSQIVTTRLINLTTVLDIEADPNNFDIYLKWKLLDAENIRAYSVQYSVNGSKISTYHIGIKNKQIFIESNKWIWFLNF